MAKKRRTPPKGDPVILAVRRFVWKQDPDPAHVFQVCRNALALFDATHGIHQLGKEERRLLQVAALMHDIGHTISVQGHHKHSRDIILKKKLPGLTPRDIRIAACVARYHRKAHPAPTHTVYSELKSDDQKRVETLAALLRVADGLDRSHEASCKRIGIEEGPKSMTIVIEQRVPNATDIWGAERKKALMEQVFGVHVAFRVTSTNANREVAS